MSNLPPAYEPPDVERVASATPDENVLDRELPGGSDTAGHDPYVALRFDSFRLYLVSWSLATVSGQMLSAAAGYEIYQRTHSAMNLGWIGLVQALPTLLLSLPAGQLADTFNRRTILAIGQITWALAAIGLTLVSWYGGDASGALIARYALLFTAGCATACSRPARAAPSRRLVPGHVFPNAVTWNASVFEVCGMIGPAVAGALIAVFSRGADPLHGIAICFAIAGAMQLACAVITSSLKVVAVAPRKAEPMSLGTLVAGLRYVWQTKLLLAAMTLDLFAVLFGGVTYLLPVFAEKLHVGPVGFGWLRAAEAIGAFAMAISQAHLPPMRRAGRSLLIAVAGFGAATIVFGLSTWYPLSLLMIFLIGALDNISVVVRHTLVQLLTPDALRGRVSAVNQVFIGSSNDIGGLESGMTAAAFGPVISVVGGGICTIAVVIAAAFTWPQIRRFGSLHDAVSPTPK